VYITMTALLVEKAEPRMLLLQALQGCKCLGYPIQAALICGDQVQDVAILGHRNRKRFGCGECFVVPATLTQLTNAAHLDFGRRGPGGAWHDCRLYSRVHCSHGLSRCE